MKICIDFGSGGGGITPLDAQMLYYFMLGILILLIALFVICDVIPWISNLVHSTMCNVSNWSVAGGRP